MDQSFGQGGNKLCVLKREIFFAKLNKERNNSPEQCYGQGGKKLLFMENLEIFAKQRKKETIVRISVMVRVVRNFCLWKT